jgi:cell shape-determining protein MreC
VYIHDPQPRGIVVGAVVEVEATTAAVALITAQDQCPKAPMVVEVVCQVGVVDYLEVGAE